MKAVAYLGFGKGGGHGERADREPITGVWKTAKKAPFHIVAFKNFHGRAMGGHHLVALP